MECILEKVFSFMNFSKNLFLGKTAKIAEKRQKMPKIKTPKNFNKKKGKNCRRERKKIIIEKIENLKIFSEKLEFCS